MHRHLKICLDNMVLNGGKGFPPFLITDYEKSTEI